MTHCVNGYTHAAKHTHVLGGCVQICASQKLLDQFVESNKLLDSVQKGLADYLETKRLAFARWVCSWLLPAGCGPGNACVVVRRHNPVQFLGSTAWPTCKFILAVQVLLSLQR